MFRLLVFVGLMMSTAVSADEIRGRVLLDDGDTPLFQVRLFGVDTPEKKQLCKNAQGECYACGAEATQFVADLLGYRVGSRYLSKEELRCEFVPGQYTYGRMVGVCYHGDDSLNVSIVRAGWGIAYRRYLDQVPALKQSFIKAEDEARAAKRGIWQGEFVEPSKWRRGGRLGCE